MSDSSKEVEKMMKKDAIFICADVWSDVFPWLSPYQLGLRLALISHRFDALVDGHFMSRKWSLRELEIYGKKGANGTKEMEIVKWTRHRKAMPSLPIPAEDIPLPDKVIGFKCICISYIDSNALAFLHKIRPLFSTCGGINLRLSSHLNDDKMIAFIRDIWPLIKGHICSMSFPCSLMDLSEFSLLNLRHECPSLKLIHFDLSSEIPFPKLFSELPSNDGGGRSAIVSGQRWVSDWLRTVRADGIPKVLRCYIYWDGHVLMKIFERQFLNSSSRVNFIIVMHFWFSWTDDFSIVPFVLRNKLTREQLTLKQHHAKVWLLVRCPIARDETQWAKWEEGAIEWRWHKQWNNIYLF